ncbi:MAG: ATP synthase F1 subunit delta [Candidatus Doudnabacteria bacterium RIFCSPLOWO2_02_FULL_48_8]|uniref:ATP synthase subunit delta n=1 Tax=Candidatus Doudnabacteria bacterium RIFCSPHIGHO2_01_FULL_46_24 TaxID=1817825 RepID=A0A1F5NTT6_9BACT|nr:MAG: ATP synthase F1 subunit delta [Candidatus Doudnabacteria bacterium RIFCSPHIGHO2_01_FULL_46_24]OGE95108.1 MAG: ATP synthase F1 subunit delta [Candidatus Doudnabacteria bacterium RIFCSPLOWO2_02_FULL_48_8]OGE95451.1 MAG: ATP synthase F1 subunit delta [Candidatus Doudnabacteria bacterium RIFCSPHIGHO2_12_FULL_48_11]
MKYTPKQYAATLMEVIDQTAPKDIDAVLDNFVAALRENNDLRMFDVITTEFHKLELAKKGITEVDVASVHPLNRDNEQAILDALNKLVKGEVKLKSRVDENLIGGVVIQVEDKVIDASVKTQLSNLKGYIVDTK